MVPENIELALKNVRGWGSEMWHEAANSPILREEVLRAAKGCGARANFSAEETERFLLDQIAEHYPPASRVFHLEIDTRKPARCANEDERYARLRLAAMLRDVADKLEATETPLAADNPIIVTQRGSRDSEIVGTFGFTVPAA